MSRFLLATVLCLAFTCQFVYAADWAVIVAGSNGFWNYRHQSDAMHAYQILHGNGVPDSNIITMIFDDIASDPSNPYPGQVFNKPTAAGPGKDVYKGMLKSYTGNDVTAANFLAVITGNSSAVPAGKPVLQSGANDRVFIYFTDHGGTGLIAFPTGNYLYATDLMPALNTMHTKKMYSKLVFYLEACESGSMFDGLLPKNVNIYATTAANPDESSYGTYCAPDDSVNGKEIGSCLGDEYSIHWMENADESGTSETLQTQFTDVKNLTVESHVMQYGDLSWTSMPIGDFEGSLQSSRTSQIARRPHHHHPAPRTNHKSVSIDSRDIKLHYMYTKYTRAAKRSVESRQAYKDLLAELQHRSDADDMFGNLAIAFAGVTSASTESLLGRPVGPYTCGECCQMVDSALSRSCGALAYSDYSLQYTNIVVNACAARGNTVQAADMLIATIPQAC